MTKARGRRGSRSDDLVVVILGGGRGTRLDPLTRLRSKPAVPLAGQYRLIDVPISNALHSSMHKIFVLTQFNSVSLHRHIVGTYTFSTFSRGFVELLAAQQTPGDDSWFQGTADAVRQNLPFISELGRRRALILSGDHLYRMDYNRMLREHVRTDAAITVGVLPCAAADIGDFGAVRVDDEGRIVEFREKPKTAEARAGMEVPDALRTRTGVDADRPYLASMGIYLFEQRVLEECLASDATDFGGEVLPAAVVGDRRVQSFVFNGYWRDIGTIKAFYDCHVDLVRPRPAFDFNDPNWPIYTRPRYLPGTRMDGSRVDRCVVANGCVVEDSRLANSVIGLRSNVRSAEVRDTLMMGADLNYPSVRGAPPVGIGAGSVVAGAIIDKNARIGRRCHLVNADGREEAEGEGWCIRDGVVIVAKNAVVPDGTVL